MHEKKLVSVLSVCVECNLTICQSEVPSCENGDKLVIGYSALSCCPEYRCGKSSCNPFFVWLFMWSVDKGQSSDWSLLECDPLACLSVPSPICREDQFLVEVRGAHACCYSYMCGKNT